MSQTKAQLVSGTTAQDLTVDNINTSSINSAQPSGRKNLIINGAMQVSQRGTSFAATDQIFMLDRYKMEKSGNAANFTVTQSTISPAGFAKSLKLDCTAADTSTGSNEFVSLRYKIEAQDLQHLGYGTSAAKPLVLSFYVRSNVTGTYGVPCLQRDNSSKIYAQTYTINSADTWERKTISIPADTSGVINDDNGSGFEIYFPLVLGSSYKGGAVSTAWETYSNAKFGSQHGVNIGSSTSNEWYLTGFQLEVGSTATDFEHRSFGEELSLCQRYCYVWNSSQAYSTMGTGYMTSTTNVDLVFYLPQIMRASPSFSNSGSFRIVGYENNTQNAQALSSFSMTRSHTQTPYLRGAISGGLTGAVGEFGDNGSNDATAIFDAEL